MLSRTVLRALPAAEQNAAAKGAFLAAGLTGLISYVSYRLYLKKEFLRSHAHYRLNQKLVNITPWESIWLSWYRMPKDDYEANIHFKPYYVIGQMDHSKEILIPKTQNGEEGFIILNPLYCYDGGKVSFKSMSEGGEAVKVSRSAIIVNRGWIPYNLKDRRSRPWDTNDNQLVKVRGTWRKGKNVHDYKIANNPDNNEWHNLCPEDIATFWELPNANELKFFYFQAVDLDGIKGTEKMETGEVIPFPQPISRDALIDEEYHWWTSQTLNNYVYKSLGTVAGISAGLSALWL